MLGDIRPRLVVKHDMAAADWRSLIMTMKSDVTHLIITHSSVSFEGAELAEAERDEREDGDYELSSRCAGCSGPAGLPQQHTPNSAIQNETATNDLTCLFR